MPLDVALAPADLARQDLGGRTVFVIDILRATTTISAMLHHGAAAVTPCATEAEARALAAQVGPAALLAGEQDCLRIPGFALGNSPREVHARAVRGRQVVMVTTNGTGLILAAREARTVYLMAAVNFTRAVARARAIFDATGDLLVACAGREGAFGLDDAYGAGRLVRAVLAGRRADLSDAALATVDLANRHGNRWLRALRRSRAGRRLVVKGLGDDVTMAARQDVFPVLPVLRDGRIVADE